MKTSIKKGPHKTSLYFICIFLLFFENLMSRVYLFNKIEPLWQAFDLIELAVYMILVYIIASRGYTIKQLLIITALGSGLLVGFLISKNAMFFRGFLIIVAGKGYDYKKILKLYMKLAIFTIGIAIILYIFGISDAGEFRRGGIALGLTHPNQLSQIVMFVSLMYMLVKKREFRFRDGIVVLAANLVISIISASRSAILIIVVAVVLALIYRKINGRKRFKWLFYAAYLVQLLMVVITVTLALNYSHSSIIQYIDASFSNLATLTGRMYLNFRALNMYDVTLFGQSVDLAADGLTVDNSYMVSILTMGIIPTVIYLFGYIILVHKCIIDDNYLLLSISIVMAVYAFVESSMIDVINFWPYLAIFSNLNGMTISKRKA